jgi:hypothetical protein
VLARDRLLFVGVVDNGIGHVDVYSQSANGCAGSPRVCTPLRSLVAPEATTLVAASARHVLVADAYHSFATWFRLDGSGCSGTPVTCAPVARTDHFTVIGRDTGTFSMANGVIYVTTGNRLLAYDESAPASCTGSPVRECRPILTKTYAASGRQPVISDGTLYVSTAAALHALRPPG